MFQDKKKKLKSVIEKKQPLFYNIEGMLTFQEIIQRLTHFWEKQGCIIHQGHDLEVGAGTFNPATFLRCLGPEPYKTAYVEPSRRPSDGRFGENPNRVQLFHQYQVILKPSPEDVQALYLQSLEAIGLDLKKHDIRFVHDDWEGPTLGAWGLGWEVWSDGMEVSQFTYFQAIGSLPLKPVSAEITYGLERLCMFIQNVDNIFDIKWNKELTLRDITHASEVEWSTYNFVEASTSMWMRHFEDFEIEAKTLIGRHLPIPAYDFVLKASHAFNMLDARGVISVTERTGYIGRIRDLARLVATEYLSSREKQGFPLSLKGKQKLAKPYAPKISHKFDASKKQDFLLEIGSEQLPAGYIPIGMRSVKKALTDLCREHDLPFEQMEVYGSPQRISTLIKGLAEGSCKKVVEKKGPPISSAFDPSGRVSPQGHGFFKSIGIATLPELSRVRDKKVHGLEIRSIKDVEYLFYTSVVEGRSTLALLAELLPKLICELEFPKKMRWADLDISYPRPLRWVVALFGDRVVPFQIGNIISDRITWGHAQLCPKKKSIPRPKDYQSLLKKLFVLVDPEERKGSILGQLSSIEKKLSSCALEKEKVLKEVLYLTEWPQLTYASFSSEFLLAPQEVLILEMTQHQRYFPLADSKGKLHNSFVITADNTPSNLIRKGNQKVLSARLSDGVFLYQQDVKQPLESFNEKLKMMTFQKELGSMFDKVLRMTKIASALNDVLSLADDKKLLRATLLCKADLTSSLVAEFPELQGTIGKYYALAQKEKEEVAQAIEEHWMPTSESSPLPKTGCGLILSLADKVDNLLGYFSVGLKPSSSSDPYALRRQTFGLLKMLLQEEKSLHLAKLLEQCAQAAYPHVKQREPLIEEILQFLTSRAKSLFEDLGHKKEEIDACLQGLCIDPYDQYCKIQALSTMRNEQKQAFANLAQVHKRAKGILESPVSALFNPSLAILPEEKKLFSELEKIESSVSSSIKERDYLHAFKHLSHLHTPLGAFFDHVKILDDNPTIRENRVALVQQVFACCEKLLDFSKIQEK